MCEEDKLLHKFLVSFLTIWSKRNSQQQTTAKEEEESAV